MLPESTKKPEKAVEAAEISPEDGADNAVPEVLMSWRVGLASRDSLLKPLAAVFLMACVLALGAFIYRDVVLVSISAGILFLATADYFIPMRFWITREAAFRRSIFGVKFIRWSNVKHCYLDSRGIKLSPLESQSRSEAFRGLFLYFGDNRDELVETVRNLAPRDRG